MLKIKGSLAFGSCEANKSIRTIKGTLHGKKRLKEVSLKTVENSLKLSLNINFRAHIFPSRVFTL